MRRLALLCLLLSACKKADHDPRRVEIYCASCSGQENTIKLSTVQPIPFAVWATWDLCFDGDTCYWGCPTHEDASACQ